MSRWKAIAFLIFCIPSVCFAQQHTLGETFEDLLQVIGQSYKPKLELVNSEVSVASYTNGSIRLERKAYKILKTFGTDSSAAFAYVLAHELAHLYSNHSWETNKGSAFLNRDFGKELIKLGLTEEDRKKDEIDADMRAGFYCQMAGYNSLAIAAKVITTLYKAYNLEDKIPGYPSLTSRIVIIDENRKTLDKLHTVFRLGNINLAAEQFDIAISCYDAILKEQFESSEIFNNRGLAQVLKAQKLFTKQELNYLFPLQISQDAHLKTLRGYAEDKKREREKLLVLSIKDFTNALERNSDFNDAYINLISANYLMFISSGRQSFRNEAENLILRMKEEGRKIDEGILVCYSAFNARVNGKVNDGITLLDRYSDKNSFAKINTELLKGQKLQKTSSPGEEMIDGINLLLEGYKATETIIKINDELSFQITKRINSIIYQCWSKSGNSTSVIQKTENEIPVSLKGVKNGTLKDKLILYYGNPTGIIISGKHKLYQYNHSRIIFELFNDRVDGWFVYAPN